jgi:hypothetical protein
VEGMKCVKKGENQVEKKMLMYLRDCNSLPLKMMLILLAGCLSTGCVVRRRENYSRACEFRAFGEWEYKNKGKIAPPPPPSSPMIAAEERIYRHVYVDSRR